MLKMNSNINTHWDFYLYIKKNPNPLLLVAGKYRDFALNDKDVFAFNRFSFGWRVFCIFAHVFPGIDELSNKRI